MCKPVDHQSVEAWIANHDFVGTLASGISVDGGLDIAGEKIRNRRELSDDCRGDALAGMGAMLRGRLSKARDGPVDQAKQLLLEFLECGFGDPIGSRGR